ncbi:DUF6580 family putative transport protein [Chryseosolibacter indicus]|uniref:Uncharacterized protein n=1 Tax=Chryseosolibacter indicus TaxID=2782351 RepID=A0ABS5VXV9_9BACT|nr:DUF6580 family putative transport protein [Chryseosolibacter indicus]MBT1706091.1 hypothetical protein [Chryseosolibacter indicus]
MDQKFSPRPIVLTLMILGVGIFRVATAQTQSPFVGFTPLGAMALFAGFYFRDRWKAYMLPLVTLWLSDIVLNRYVYFGYWVFFYNSFIWVYVSFALMVLVGQLFKTVTIRNVFLSCISAAGLHFLFSNFGVWLMGCTGTAADILYTPDISGLLSCYRMGLPLLGNLLMGNFIFSAILFGAFEWMQRRYSVLQLNV